MILISKLNGWLRFWLALNFIVIGQKLTRFLAFSALLLTSYGAFELILEDLYTNHADNTSTKWCLFCRPHKITLYAITYTVNVGLYAKGNIRNGGTNGLNVTIDTLLVFWHHEHIPGYKLDYFMKFSWYNSMGYILFCLEVPNNLLVSSRLALRY